MAVQRVCKEQRATAQAARLPSAEESRTKVRRPGGKAGVGCGLLPPHRVSLEDVAHSQYG
ncbi:hypothetical protein OE88DRAFT_1653347 [Heliocybe sulcata]|uniref:Uncharacterized protein n=1 Tax=Heliocybe sulcata TaxID=5364 RepID=A0A5C3NC21_9AGAM|nr:hypothetical protein OE88DRAFT_1653347 [Heliocybe sulcata]